MTRSRDFIVKFNRDSDGVLAGRRVSATSTEHAVAEASRLQGYEVQMKEVWGRHPRTGVWRKEEG